MGGFFMKSKSIRISNMILALCEIIVGVLLLVDPIGFTVGIVTFLGAVLLLGGIVSIIQYFRTAPEEAALGQRLALGLLEGMIGLFCILRSGWFVATFPLFTVIYGIITLVTGFIKIQWTVDMLRMKRSKWFWGAISAVLTLICAVIVLCNPFSTTAVLWTFVAVTLIVEAVIDLLAAIFTRGTAD